MAININIYSNANSSSKTISFDFVGDILAASTPPPVLGSTAVDYYFKVTTGARQDNNVAYPLKLVRGLDELVLNKNKQRIVNTANAYSDIKSMILDYTYDYINGHSANLYSSSCTVQYPMKF
jgi:hypothetical protein